MAAQGSYGAQQPTGTGGTTTPDGAHRRLKRMRSWGHVACELRWLLSPLLLVPFLLFTGALVELVPWPGSTVGLVASARAEGGALEFTACSFFLPCRNTDRPLLELLRYAEAHAREVAAHGYVPTFVHIGDVEASSASWSTDIDLFGKVLAPMPQELLDKVRLIFVEPSQERAELIWENVRRLPVKESRVQVINAVVRKRCIESPSERLFRVSPRAEKDYSVSSAVYGSWRSRTDEDKGVQKTINLYAFASQRKEWLDFVDASKLSEYTDEVQVPCLTPVQMLQEANKHMAVPDMTYVSVFSMVVVEGQGSCAIEGLVDLPLFQPGYFQFNHHTMTAERVLLLARRLKSHGLVVGGIEGEDIGIALSSAVSLPPSAAREGLRVAPQFSVCDTPEPCGAEGSGWKYWGDLLQGPGLAAREVVARGDVPVALHIGSNTFASELPFADVDLHSRAIQSLPPGLRYQLKFVMLDANAEVSSQAERSAARLPIDPGRVWFVNAMVSDKCSSDSALMYRFSSNVVREFRVSGNAIKSWLVPTREHLSVVLGDWAARAAKGWDDGYAAGWQALLNAPNISAYVEEVNVPCLTVAALVTLVGGDISNLISVVIDADTANHRILSAMLEFPNFKPGYLQFEEGSLVRETQALLSKLQSRGFQVGWTRPRLSTEKSIIAVPFNSSLVRLKPRFSACDSPHPCGPENTTWRHLLEPLRGARSVVEELERRGSETPAVFLQIGAMQFAPFKRHTVALQLLPERLRQSVRLAVVDPDEFQQNSVLAQTNFTFRQFKFIRAAVTDECQSDHVSRYRISQAAETDFGVQGASSYFLDSRVWFGPKNEWRAFAEASNRSAYFIEVRVPCLPISAALSKAGIALDSLATVIINDRTSARRLVNSMLESQGFRPGFLQFKLDDWDSWGTQVLLQKLHDRGLAVGRLYGGRTPTDVVVAVRNF